MIKFSNQTGIQRTRQSFRLGNCWFTGGTGAAAWVSPLLHGGREEKSGAVSGYTPKNGAGRIESGPR